MEDEIFPCFFFLTAGILPDKVIAYLEKHGPAYSQCRRDLDLELVLTSKDLRGIYSEPTSLHQ